MNILSIQQNNINQKPLFTKSKEILKNHVGKSGSERPFLMSSALFNFVNLKFPQDGIIWNKVSQAAVFETLNLAYRPYKISTISAQLSLVMKLLPFDVRCELLDLVDLGYIGLGYVSAAHAQRTMNSRIILLLYFKHLFRWQRT